MGSRTVPSSIKFSFPWQPRQDIETQPQNTVVKAFFFQQNRTRVYDDEMLMACRNHGKKRQYVDGHLWLEIFVFFFSSFVLFVCCPMAAHASMQLDNVRIWVDAGQVEAARASLKQLQAQRGIT